MHMVDNVLQDHSALVEYLAQEGLISKYLLVELREPAGVVVDRASLVYMLDRCCCSN